jgi:hypothetical protein
MENQNIIVEEPITSLAALSKDASNVSVYTTDTLLSEIAKSRVFLPYIKIASAQAKEVTKDKICSAGDFLMTRGKDDVVKLGDRFECVPLAFRVKTTVFTKDDKVLAYYDPESKEFKDAREKSKVFDNGCMFGVECLLWVPEHETFATWFAYNVTALNEVNSIRSRTGQLSILKTKFIESKKFSWYGPQILPCSNPYKEPDLNLAASTIKEFNNPKSSEVEVAEEGTADSRAR